LDVLPSPKSQYHDIGSPLELSVNLTSKGTFPLTTSAEKEAIGDEAVSEAFAIPMHRNDTITIKVTKLVLIIIPPLK
jgi:hypothetical protein